MRALLACVALLAASPAGAQALSAAPAADAPSRADVSAVQQQAGAALSAAAAAIAAVPPPCTVVPAPDASTGTLGTGTTCVHRADAAAQTTVMPASTTTASDGSFAGTWPGTFASAPTTAIASAKTTADPYTCQVGTATTTGYAGKCWRTAQTVTLPTLAPSLLGLVLTTAPAATAGLTVMVVGRQ